MNDQPFYSIDRLVAFGLELGVAQQMLNAMNHALQHTVIPGPHNAPLQQQFAPCHLALDGAAAGPFGAAEIMQLIQQGRVNKETLAWRIGMSTWQKVGTMPDLLRLVALSPPPLPPEAKP